MNRLQEQSMTVSIDSPSALLSFNQCFGQLFEQQYTKAYDHIVILCIGCDRATGDTLGPLVGTKLAHLTHKYQHIHILGSLKHPVHALNLMEALDTIQSLPKPFVIAVDASLGNAKSVGNIILKDQGLRPGSGVGKDLPQVGQMSIAGIVNVGGFMENAVLQCTSLYLVNRMADVISQGLYYQFGIKQQSQSVLSAIK